MKIAGVFFLNFVSRFVSTLGVDLNRKKKIFGSLYNCSDVVCEGSSKL